MIQVISDHSLENNDFESSTNEYIEIFNEDNKA